MRTETILLLVTVIGNTMAATNIVSYSNNINDLSAKIFIMQLAECDSKSFSFSPASIFTALAMLYEGASLQNKLELSQLLRLPEDDSQRRESILNMISQLNKGQRGETFNYETMAFEMSDLFKTTMANSVWLSNKFTPKPTYTATLKQHYKATAESIDFASIEAPSIVNAWISANTGGLINHMIDSIDSDTLMMLVNAVYFKARWLTDFDGSQTYERSVDGRQVPFMRSSGMQAKYVAVDGVVMLQLKYRSDSHSMVIRMADDDVQHFGVDDIEKLINDDIMPSRIDLHMPKFQIDTKIGLNGYLQRLGVSSIFTPSTTGWQGITDSAEILVSSVLHRSKVNVEELGTEAAAVTAIMVGTTAFQMDPPISVILEKPFSFAIYDSETKSVLFSGAIFN